MINQHIPQMSHPMGYLSQGGYGSYVGQKYPNHMIPPDTPVSMLPQVNRGIDREKDIDARAGAPQKDRRRSPAMRAGMQMAGDNQATMQTPQQPIQKQGIQQNKPPVGIQNNSANSGKRQQKQGFVDYEAQYSGMTAKQLIGIIRERDSKVNDLIEGMEVGQSL